MIIYLDSVDGIGTDQLKGFFAGWPNPPSLETHLKLLKKSDHILVAVDEASTRVVGFVTAISDGVLSAYMPLLEVLPEYQGQGIGRELVKRMLARLNEYYMIDLVCDKDMQSFYTRFGMKPFIAMAIRNYDRQSGS